MESLIENLKDNLTILKEVYSDSDSEEEPNKSINNKSGTHLHIIESKLKIIKYAKEHTRKEACNKFSVPNSTLGDWIKKDLKNNNLLDDKLKKLHCMKEELFYILM